MKINVEFIAIERPQSGAADNGETVEVADGAAVSDALVPLNLGRTKSFMTLVNGDPVPPEEREKTRLKDGDTLCVFRPLKGG
jgi:thiamine biosynthesis protein ThiS